MLKKRLIGVITVKDGWAVQSIGYRKYLPLGTPECIAENLDRWCADEILVLCIDRSKQELGPNFDILNRLSGMGLATPLTYGGGIRSLDDAIKVIQTGADRICLDALLRDDTTGTIEEMSSYLGAQALIASLPIGRMDDGIGWYDYRNGTTSELRPEILDMLDTGIISEALAIDWQNEGGWHGFDPQLLDVFADISSSLILFGGLRTVEQMREMLVRPDVSAVASGNFLSYREHAVQQLKSQLVEFSVRPAVYEAGE